MAKSSVIKVSLLGDSSKLQAAFRDAERSGDGWASKMARVGGDIIGTFVDVAKKVVLAVAAIATAIAAIAIKGGIQRALDTEDAIVQMRRLGLTTEEVEAAVDAVDRAFDGTVFTNPEGFALFGRLQGLGVELDEIPGYISTIADMAAHGNVPLDQMSSIFERIISNGKVTGEELNRLADAGIPLTEVANALGLTVPEMRKLVSEGKLTSDVFLEAVDSIEMFEGAAQSAGDTTRGAWSNTLSQLKKLGELVVSPLFGENGPMVTLFKAMRQALIDFRPQAKAVGDALGAWLIPKMEALGEWLAGGGLPKLVENIGTKFSEWKDKLKELWPYVQRGIDYVKDLFDRLKKGENPLKGVTEGFMMMGAPMMLLVKELFPALKPLLEAILPALVEIANDAAPALAEIFGELVRVLLPPLVSFLGWLADILKEHPDLILAVVTAMLAFKGIAFIAGIISAISAAFGVLTTVMAINPFVLLAVAIVTLAVLIYKNWDSIVAFLKKAWDWIKDTAASVGKWFSDKFKEAVEFVKNLFLNFTGPGLLIKHWDTIKDGVKAVVTFFRDKWNDLIDWFKAIPGRVSDALKTIWDNVKSLTNGVKTWIQDRFNEILTWMGGVPSKMWNKVKGMFDGIKDAFRTAINYIIDKWNNFKFQIGGKQVTLPFGMSFTIPSITLDTPNIPRLHSGGVFHAPGGGEGLALLRDGERVLTPAQDRNQGTGTSVYVTVQAGVVLDEYQAGRKVAEFISQYLRAGGRIEGLEGIGTL